MLRASFEPTLELYIDVRLIFNSSEKQQYTRTHGENDNDNDNNGSNKTTVTHRLTQRTTRGKERERVCVCVMTKENTVFFMNAKQKRLE